MPRRTARPTLPDGLDATDVKILREVQRNGRAAVTEIAEKAGLSPTPTQRRLARLEADGYIRAYRARLDRKLLGRGLTVFAYIKVEGHRTETAVAVQRFLDARPEIVRCAVVSGEYDLLAEIAVADIEAFERLLFDNLFKLPLVRDVRSHFVIREMKDGEELDMSGL